MKNVQISLKMLESIYTKEWYEEFESVYRFASYIDRYGVFSNIKFVDMQNSLAKMKVLNNMIIDSDKLTDDIKEACDKYTLLIGNYIDVALTNGYSPYKQDRSFDKISFFTNLYSALSRFYEEL